MSGRFNAFSFVDRITELESGKHAKGRFLVPVNVPRFPVSLLAEAAGQLAAWNAMAHLGFQVRPVAGLCAEIRFGEEARPGQTLDATGLVHEAYLRAGGSQGGRWGPGHGTGSQCGTLLPMEDSIRRRQCGSGSSFFAERAPSGRFRRRRGLIEIIEQVPEERVRATLRLPKEAEFFSDHFPRRPVFPATLLLDAQIALGLKLVAGSKRWPPGARLVATRVPDMKMRSFIAPGEVMELGVDLEPPTGEAIALATTRARVNGKLVGSGRLEIVAANGPLAIGSRRSRCTA
jgi:3-hydroxymyristoyl/3-hydroxydecanoyl-(acyl carrier protein) dehydratase